MCTKSWLGQGFSTQSSPTSHLLASERLEDRIAQMGVFGYVCYCHRRLTDIPANVPHSRADGHLRGIRLRQHRGNVRSLVVSVGWESVVGAGCGQAGEQHIEAAVEFGGAVVGG
jgi:hypothetical protein